LDKLDFSVVVITRNRPSILAQCLDHLALQVLPASEILVIDSSEDFVPLEQYPGVKHVHFPAGRNQMPKARNEGARLASGAVIAYIDDDCLVDENWLACLADSYHRRPGLAGVGGRIVDARWKYNPAGPIGKATSDGYILANFFGDPGELVEADLLPGGNMSFRRDWLLRSGGFDPRYVATNHREDPDFCLRLRRAGGVLAYQGRAIAHHLNARNALGELSPWHEFYLRYSYGRNEGFFLCRHFPREVVRRWFEDSMQQAKRSYSARSIVAFLCIWVQFFAFGLGIASYLIDGKVPREIPSTRG
jgi:GT2 family glycosyltransferase